MKSHAPLPVFGLTGAVLAFLALSPMTQGALTTAGELVVDLRAHTLNASATTWTNQDASGDTVGNFSTYGGGNLNVASVGGVSKALHVNNAINNAVISAVATPASIEGNNTRSVEAWIYANGTGGSSTPVGWGASGNGAMSSFRYTGNTGNGLFSGWFIDAGWGGASLPAGEWIHVAWTYDGMSVRGYTNGILANAVDLSGLSYHPLVTSHKVLCVGSGREGVTDPFDGYVADVRVHTGVLSDADVLNNYHEGIYVAGAEAPGITGLGDQTAVVGDNVILNPSVTGTAPIASQWRSNNVALAGETNTTLTLANVQLSQDGSVYSLIATNAIGAATNSMTLTVLSAPPSLPLTLNLDVNKTSGEHYTGSAIAADFGTYWNSFVVPAASSQTLTGVRDSSNNVTVSSITLRRDSGSNFSVWDGNGPNGNPTPFNLMRDYLFSGPYTTTVSNLPAGTYHLFVYAHGDNTGQASSVSIAGSNGGASGSTTDTGDYRNIYQAGAEGNAYLRLLGTVGGSGVFAFSSTYLNGFQLQRLSPPVLAGLANQTVVAGTTAVLSPTTLLGTPPPSLQWRSNSIALPGQTNATLVLNDVQYAQNGTLYSILAGNVMGAATNSMVLSVIVTPSISNLANQAVATGGTVTMAPTVSGVPAPALRWLHNGLLSDGPTGNGSTVSGSTTGTLSITNAQNADSGSYSLIASNSAGVVTNSMTLTVSSTNVPPEISGPIDQTVVQGDTATFAASASGLPLPTLQWHVNGALIPGATSASLMVANVQYSQNGDVYSVVAGNAAGSKTNSATLSVLVPPGISQQPTNLTVVAGGPALFSVAASGVPSVSHQWRKNGDPISHATNATYTVASATGADNGAVFSVVVSNSVGSVTSSDAVLTVLSTMAGSFLPTHNAAGISPDQQLRIVFSGGTPRLGSGKLHVRNAVDDSVFATIDTSQFITFSNDGATVTNGALRTLQGKSCYYEPIAVEGNVAWITLDPGKRFAYNKTYYVTFDSGLFRDGSNASFPGITSSNTWRFSTKPGGPATPTASTGPTHITVGLDGAGDFATLQGASDWIPQNNTLQRTIRISPGTYRDYALFEQNRNKVTIVGAGTDPQDVLLYYPYPSVPSGGIGVLTLDSSDIQVLNLDLDTRAYETFPGRMRSLITTGHRLVFDNVLIKGGQDTLYTISGSAYFKDCEIWGSVDFIYGAALAVFDQCTIVEVRDSGGPITAPNTPYSQPYGLVFLNCTFPRATVAAGYPYNVGTGSTTFQRPWGNDGATAIINSQLGTQFSTKGWAEWGGRENTCRCIEYGSTLIGGGAAPTVFARQSAGAYWLNTRDPDYTSSSMDPLGASLAPPSGHLNRTNITVNPADYTLDAIFGHPYFGLGSWRPAALPFIAVHPANTTANAGSPALFSVTALGLPDPAYQWRKDGTNIVGATNAVFSIPDAKLADNGAYSVIVSNSAGSVVSSNAVLTVPPESTLITPVITNGVLSLSWPASQTGYRLLAQTNLAGVGLTTNWHPVPDSAGTNQISFLVDPGLGSVFLRLVYP